MALASLISRGQAGLRAIQITVEVHLAGGLPGFAVTGLPAPAVRESKDRVRAALQTCAFKVPVSRVTVHLGPADIPKHGGRFDLPIALGVIKAEQVLEWSTQRTEFLGELALNGDLKPINGALPAVLAARADGHSIVLPAANAAEAALVADVEAYGCEAPHRSRGSSERHIRSCRASRMFRIATLRRSHRTLRTCAARMARSARSSSRPQAGTTC